ncbi:pentatricopeptide repeat-containing protein 2, mitochondrial isoform X1 [Astyanax mexicanus]|uniref:Pentatricopeptide repeat-containing protein 2, mitochondrial n=2 Tax=Astyanax mexicanus TaxID=7994 RepID=A0A8B9KJS3_ASTMX|nr:pentatricopeptide repeat-containing protein 2, mitochondrial isoform X1 [Astyanax mexicanus]KAG9281968.1 pentatricopeptide repeat-containing protein 2, mitochondrial isoform X1 [Astyanax mexicanus]
MALQRGLSRCARFALQFSLDSGCFKCRAGAKRHLLSEDLVRLQDFQLKKLYTARHLPGTKSHFFEALNQKMERNELILQEDLKQVLHLCQSPEDMVTVRNAIYRYHEVNPNSTYRFGPLFMRLCYELRMEDVALGTITDQKLKGFFSEKTSFNIMMDMLFTKGSYESALKVMREMKSQGITFSKETFTLVFATCYKLNTPSSYHICLTLMEKGQTKGNPIPTQAYCCAVALALKQNDTKRAQIIYYQILNKNNRLCGNLKVLMLVLAGSIEDAVAYLKKTLSSKSPSFIGKLNISQEVVDVLREKSVGGPWEVEAQEVVMQLQEAGHVIKQSMDEMLCHTPQGKLRPLGFFDEEKKRQRNSLKTSTLLSQ